MKATLKLHPYRPGKPYYLGVFLTGAYQDVLANMHNLFGRVNEAHLRVEGPDQYRVELVVNGQKAWRVIENMGYEGADLHSWIEQDIREAQSRGLLDEAGAAEVVRLYDAELVGYTYLEQAD